MRKKFVLSSIIITLILLFSLTVQAQTTIDPAIGSSLDLGYADVETSANEIMQWIVGILLMISFVLIIIGVVGNLLYYYKVKKFDSVNSINYKDDISELTWLMKVYLWVTSISFIIIPLVIIFEVFDVGKSGTNILLLLLSVIVIVVFSSLSKKAIKKFSVQEIIIKGNISAQELLDNRNKLIKHSLQYSVILAVATKFLLILLLIWSYLVFTPGDHNDVTS